MEGTTIVLSTGGQGEKVVCSFGAGLAEKLQLYVSMGCAEGERHDEMYSVRCMQMHQL